MGDEDSVKVILMLDDFSDIKKWGRCVKNFD